MITFLKIPVVAWLRNKEEVRDDLATQRLKEILGRFFGPKKTKPTWQGGWSFSRKLVLDRTGEDIRGKNKLPEYYPPRI